MGERVSPVETASISRVEPAAQAFERSGPTVPPIRRRRRPPLIWFSGAVILAIAAWFVLRPTADPLSRYEIEMVTQGDIEDAVSATGKIRPRSYVDVGAQVSGQLTRLHVAAGDKVAAGDLLIEIDPQIPAAKVAADRADLARLEADLAEQQAQLEYARNEFGRQTQLRRNDTNSESTLDRARRDMLAAAAKSDSIRAQIQQMQSTLKADEAQLSYTRIYAPIGGTVVAVSARQGQTINATYSTPILLRIADLSTLTVWTQVSEADIPRLTEGMPLYFTTLGYRSRRWTATLRQILPAPPNSTPSTDANGDAGAANAGARADTVVLYTALFDVPNQSNELRPDMTAQVFFVVTSARDAVLVPLEALERMPEGGDRFTAKVVGDDGRVAEREVRVGIRDRFTAQVLSGLSPGDRVVTGTVDSGGGSGLIGFLL